MAETTQRHKIGFIGAGMIAQIGHLPFYLADPRIDVAGVAESRASLVENLRETFGITAVVADYDTLLANPAIETVVIVAPRSAQAPIVFAALRAGKNVIVEKPLAYTAAQARRLVDAARDSGVSLTVAYMKRYDGGVLAAKRAVDELIGSGRMGALLTARFYNRSAAYGIQPPPHRRPSESRAARFPEWPLVPDWMEPALSAEYDWFINVASHDVNLMRFFVADAPFAVDHGERSGPFAVEAVLRSGPIEVRLSCARGDGGDWDEGAVFEFEGGRVELALPSPMAVDRVARVEIVAEDGGGRETVTAEPIWCFESQAKAFIKQIAQGTAAPTSGDDACADLEMIEDIWRAIAGART